jgi:tetratricopeptide (TPR) repeat protein
MQGGGLRARQLRSEALEVLKSALESDPELVEAYLLIARLNLLPEGDAEEVLKSTTKAIELLADNPQAQSGAYLLRALRQTDEKRRSDDLDAAIKTNPTNAEAIQARALLRLQNNDVNGAVDDLKALLKQDPTNQAVAQVAVQQLVEMGRTSDALTLLDEALQASPSEGLYRLRGIIYRAEGKEDEALADFDKALAMQPKDPISLLQRAEISLGRGDVKAAKRDLSEAIRVEPRVVDSVAAVRVRCYIAVEEGRMADAINDMNLIVQADPENSFWTLQLANLYLQDKRPRKAIELATAIIDREPENVSALRTRADTLLGLGDHAGAIKDYERAIEVGVDNPLQKSGILNNLAWVLATSPKEELRSGERSVKFGTEAAELTEFKEPHILSTLAAGYAEQGDFEKAVLWSTKAVELGRELEHEQVEQLEEELKSYQENKPWREEQETEENRAPLLGPDDLIDT